MQRLVRLTRLAYSSPAVRQSAVASVGNVLTGIIAALAIILASRVLGPVGFGIFSVATSLIAVFSKIGDVGLNALVTRFLPSMRDSQSEAAPLLGHLILGKVVFTLGGAALILLLIPQLSRTFNYDYPTIWWYIVAGAVTLAIFEYVSVLLSALHEFVWTGVMGISQAILKLIAFGLLGVLAVSSPDPLIFIYALAPMLGVILVLPRFARWLIVRPRWSSLWQAQVKKYAGHAAVGMIAITLIANIDVLIVQKFLTPFDTGVYAGAARIAQFVSLMAISVSSVLNNRVARYKARSTQRAYLKKSLSIVGVAILGFLVFLPLAHTALVLTIGSEFLPGLPALIILVANAFLGLALIPYISFFYSLEVPHYFSVGGILQTIVILVLSLVYLPQFGLMAAAYARLAATGVFGVYTVGMIWYFWWRVRE